MSEPILTMGTLEDLARRIAPPPLPDWAKVIRGADKVAVYSSDFLLEGEDVYLVNPDRKGRDLTVLCRPQHKTTVKELVAMIRSGAYAHTDHPTEEGEDGR